MMMNTGSKGAQGAYLGGQMTPAGSNAPMMFNPSMYGAAPAPPFQPQQVQQQQQQQQQPQQPQPSQHPQQPQEDQRPPTMGYQEPIQQNQGYPSWDGYSQYDQYQQYYSVSCKMTISLSIINNSKP